MRVCLDSRIHPPALPVLEAVADIVDQRILDGTVTTFSYAPGPTQGMTTSQPKKTEAYNPQHKAYNPTSKSKK